MPLINLFIFPIIGGYYILIRSEFIRYRQQRLEPQKLIFNSFLAGLILIISAWILSKGIILLAPDLVTMLKRYYPIRQPYFGTCVGSFLLAVVFTEVTNLFVSKDSQISAAINKMGNEFERLCESCYRDLELIQVTLKNGKCYVGLLKGLPIPSHSNYIRILPTYSGYRESETKELVFTTQYLDVYASYVRDGEAVDIRDITTLVLRIDEIVSATRFDAEMYERFGNHGPTDSSGES